MLTFGCACADFGGEELGTTSQEIVGGAADAGDPAVGELLLPPTLRCSLTMVYDRFALTARHCVQVNGKDPRTRRITWGELRRPEDMRVSFAQTPSAESVWYQVVDYRYHTSADIAVVELDKAPGPTVAMNAQDITAFVGQPVRIVGYGRMVSDPGPASQMGGVKRQGFSSMFRTASLPDIGPSIITGLQIGQAGAKLCQGDSGGPAFMRVNGVEVLVGVNSVVFPRRGTEPTGQTRCEDDTTDNVHARVDRHVEWINEGIADMEGGTTAFTNACNASGGGTWPLAWLAIALGLCRRRLCGVCA